ncbi:DUF2785 domain-containing protein [Levilactobacillus acidifarinae]|uniref:DUF2785 domain-containing protein n=1 Tax=Levilactobacillus acidifarinae DSM 19394 = JCM 15949 TaxID=1423715 RepID=A0A0R1LR61_9LACO|nr:DUF2785 domain-containing protein [Levilactobacillus acidifarinae]KRK93783.1 hypothetical protein FD25_GL001110 [Levilactobacillus acidifarinae DSM 19394]GEO68666.1 hypothetical protein LAC03_05760 [Levilactobacillus acidifarinae]
MDEQIETLQQHLQDLRHQLHAGTVYQSLGDRIGHLIDGVHRQRRTPIALPDEQDGIQDLLKDVSQGLEGDREVHLTLAELDHLLQHLRSTNPKIRYLGVHFTLYDALEDGVFSAAQIQWLVTQLLRDDRLFDHILEPSNQGVYGRSAAMSFLATLIHYSNDHPKLVQLDYDEIVVKVATYICLETDTRGFINQQGWAHAFTSITELLTTLGDGSQLTRADKLFLMVTLLERFKRLATPLIYGETERMGGYLVMLTNRHPIYESACLTALKQWRQQVALHRRATETAAGWNQFYNRRRLLDAMRLQRDLSPQIRAYLSSAIDFLA